MGSNSSSSTAIHREPSTSTDGCPMHRSPQSVSVESESSTCPVRSSLKPSSSVTYNVYNEVIDPLNQIPTNTNQRMYPDQKTELSTVRVSSGIPKGGTDSSTWTYPSAQMFWNALSRKNKLEGVEEIEMNAVIAVHNSMNENTWQQVLEWEKLHASAEAAQPKLRRFMGRPDDLSPKARLKMLFGHPAPFDRHDWYVDRRGEEVRYVIDYYHDESAVELDVRPSHLRDTKSMRSIQVDVRPALDSPQSLFDRIFRMPLLQARGETAFRPPNFFPPSEMVIAEQKKTTETFSKLDQITQKCVREKNVVSKCASEESCRSAAVALQRCTASILCPDVVSEFDLCVDKKNRDPKLLNDAYDRMITCNEIFAIDVRVALEKKKS